MMNSPMMRHQPSVATGAALVEVSARWMELMSTSPGQLREKMALFWHGHFAC